MRTREEAGHTDELDDVAVDGELVTEEPTLIELFAEIQRATHDGVFEPKMERHEFTRTQIVAWVNDLKINRKGDVVVTFTVPYRYRHFALPLSDAQGLPLSLDIVRWARFEQYEKVSPETQTAIEAMIRCGVPVKKVSDTLGVPFHKVNEIAKFRDSKTFSTQLNAKDQELAEGLRALTWRALKVAEETLMFGSPQDQQMISRAIVARSMSLIGAERTNKLDELRESFHELIGGQSSAEPIEYELPEDRDVIDV